MAVNFSKLNEDVARDVLGLELHTWEEDDVDKPTQCCAWYNKSGAKVYDAVLPVFHDYSEALKIVENMVFAKNLLFLVEKREKEEVIIFKVSFLSHGGCLGEGEYHSLPIAICIAAIAAAKNL